MSKRGDFLRRLKAKIENPEIVVAQHKYYDPDTGYCCVLGHVAEEAGVDLKTLVDRNSYPIVASNLRSEYLTIFAASGLSDTELHSLQLVNDNIINDGDRKTRLLDKIDWLLKGEENV